MAVKLLRHSLKVVLLTKYNLKESTRLLLLPESLEQSINCRVTTKRVQAGRLYCNNTTGSVRSLNDIKCWVVVVLSET